MQSEIDRNLAEGGQNSQKRMRLKELEQKLTKLREMEVNIEQDLVKNGNLKKV